VNFFDEHSMSIQWAFIKSSGRKADEKRTYSGQNANL